MITCGFYIVHGWLHAPLVPFCSKLITITITITIAYIVPVKITMPDASYHYISRTTHYALHSFTHQRAVSRCLRLHK